MADLVVGIIGTAGRGEDGDRMTLGLFTRMVDFARAWINVPGVKLVSGGAAWADHVAVRLFLTDCTDALTLHLPASWDWERGGFLNAESNRSGRDPDPARTATYYHTRFSRVIGVDTLAELEQARRKGAVLIPHAGFHMRNRAVARDATALLAFTWGLSLEEPKDGGTKHTWDCAAGKIREHVPLASL